MIAVALSQSATLPPLATELRSLLSRFVALNRDPLALARERSEDLFDLLLKLADPAAVAWLDRIDALATHHRQELAHRTP